VIRLSAKDATLDKFLEIYNRNQVLLVKGLPVEPPDRPQQLRKKRSTPPARGEQRQRGVAQAIVDLTALRQVLQAQPRMVHRTFFVETAPASWSPSSAAGAGDPLAASTRLLGTPRPPAGPWYASFVVQRSRLALAAFLKSMPFSVPPFLRPQAGSRPKVKASIVPQHSQAAWVFFGRNAGQKPMRGRAEHTDAISHSGTWHVQLQGSKVWTLRPTAELKRQNRALKAVSRLRVHCRPGDVLCINTRLWWHQTHIPGNCPLTLSVARDMYLDGTKPRAPDFTNIKGHFATRPFDRNEIVFTEEEAPDLALPRSEKANCALRDLDGELVVVAKRKIQAGDWFCISESEEEDEAPPTKARKSRS